MRAIGATASSNVNGTYHGWYVVLVAWRNKASSFSVLVPADLRIIRELKDWKEILQTLERMGKDCLRVNMIVYIQNPMGI